MRIIGLKRFLTRLMPKADHHLHGEPKDQRLNGLLTATGKQGLTNLAKEYGVSVSELLEKIGRRELVISQATGEIDSPGKLKASS